MKTNEKTDNLPKGMVMNQPSIRGWELKPESPDVVANV